MVLQNVLPLFLAWPTLSGSMYPGGFGGQQMYQLVPFGAAAPNPNQFNGGVQYRPNFSSMVPMNSFVAGSQYRSYSTGLDRNDYEQSSSTLRLNIPPPPLIANDYVPGLGEITVPNPPKTDVYIPTYPALSHSHHYLTVLRTTKLAAPVVQAETPIIPVPASPAHLEAVHVAPVRVDPVHVKPVHVVPVKVEPVHVTPVHVEPVRVDPSTPIQPVVHPLANHVAVPPVHPAVVLPAHKKQEGSEDDDKHVSDVPDPSDLVGKENEHTSEDSDDPTISQDNQSDDTFEFHSMDPSGGDDHNLEHHSEAYDENNLHLGHHLDEDDGHHSDEDDGHHSDDDDGVDHSELPPVNILDDDNDHSEDHTEDIADHGTEDLSEDHVPDEKSHDSDEGDHEDSEHGEHFEDALEDPSRHVPHGITGPAATEDEGTMKSEDFASADEGPLVESEDRGISVKVNTNLRTNS